MPQGPNKLCWGQKRRNGNKTGGEDWRNREGTIYTGEAMERDGQQLAESSTEYVLSKTFDGVRLPLICIMQVKRRLWRVGRSTLKGSIVIGQWRRASWNF